MEVFLKWHGNTLVKDAPLWTIRNLFKTFLIDWMLAKKMKKKICRKFMWGNSYIYKVYWDKLGLDKDLKLISFMAPPNNIDQGVFASALKPYKCSCDGGTIENSSLMR